MKVVFTYDKRTFKPDWFIYLDRGPLPPLVNPPEPRIPQDTGPEDPDEDKKRKERPS